MNLDKRIKDTHAIYDCFGSKLVKKYIVGYGYFSNCIFDFANLDDVKYSKLTEVRDNGYYPYVDADGQSSTFFLPEEFVEPKVKALRPYTIEEFQKNFTLGSPIKFRRKDDKEHPVNLVFLGYTWLNDRIAVEIGHEKYFLDGLLNDFEWFNEYKDEYTPFGVEV
jgi:hypothetical protein